MYINYLAVAFNAFLLSVLVRWEPKELLEIMFN